MPLDPQIRKNWIELQRKSSTPVNAIGLTIDPSDQFTLKVWKDEGIDRYLKGRDAGDSRGES